MTRLGPASATCSCTLACCGCATIACWGAALLQCMQGVVQLQDMLGSSSLPRHAPAAHWLCLRACCCCCCHLLAPRCCHHRTPFVVRASSSGDEVPCKQVQLKAAEAALLLYVRRLQHSSSSLGLVCGQHVAAGNGSGPAKYVACCPARQSGLLSTRRLS